VGLHPDSLLLEEDSCMSYGCDVRSVTSTDTAVVCSLYMLHFLPVFVLNCDCYADLGLSNHNCLCPSLSVCHTKHCDKRTAEDASVIVS